MRILVLNYEFPPLGGGAGQATYYLTRELALRGWVVDVVTSRWQDHEPHAPDGVRVWAVPADRHGIHECGLRAAAQYVVRGWALAGRLCEQERYDLSHSFFSLPTGLISRRLKARLGLPYVVSLRGSDVPGYDPSVSAFHRPLAPLTRAVWRDAGAVVALSPALASLAQGFHDLPLEVIGNGVDSSLFRPAPSEPAVQDGDLRIVCVSRLVERKGIQHLLQALARAPQVAASVDIAGAGPYETTLRSLAESLGLAQRVRFLGRVAHADLPALYQSYELLALPSLAESFGNVFTEALACGLPVLATRVGGIPTIVRDGTDGVLVEPGDVAALSTALACLASDKARLRSMGMAGRERMASEFTWSAIADRYEETYRRVIRASPAR